MDWDSELVSATQKAPPRKGRRAGLSLLGSRDEEKSSFEEALDNSTSDSNTGVSGHANQQPMPPPRGRRANWANEDVKSSKKRGVSSSVSGLLDRQRFQSPDRLKSGFDSDDDIPVIPDLDDVVDEDFKPLVTYTSSVAMNRVATYKELDSAGPSYLKLDGIDLGVLSKYLDIEDEENVDEDKVLTWDMLYTEVASQLRNGSEGNSQSSVTET